MSCLVDYKQNAKQSYFERRNIRLLDAENLYFMRALEFVVMNTHTQKRPKYGHKYKNRLVYTSLFLYLNLLRIIRLYDIIL